MKSFSSRTYCHVTTCFDFARPYPDPRPSLPRLPPPPTPLHLILMVTRRTTVMRMTPQPMPPMMLRNGSISPRPRFDDDDGGACAGASPAGGSAASGDHRNVTSANF